MLLDDPLELENYVMKSKDRWGVVIAQSVLGGINITLKRASSYCRLKCLLLLAQVTQTTSPIVLGFLQPNPHTAMLFSPFGCIIPTHFPLSHPFCSH